MITMEQECKEMRDNEAVLNQHLEENQKKLRNEKVECAKLGQIASNMKSMHEKMKVGMQPIESTLSCLSCLEYLAEPSPLTLICGHSICAKVSILLLMLTDQFFCLLQCFNQHSDPNSSDSLVFCEECKVESKNKQLRDSKVIRILSSKFNGQRSMIASMEKILSKI